MKNNSCQECGNDTLTLPSLSVYSTIHIHKRQRDGKKVSSKPLDSPNNIDRVEMLFGELDLETDGLEFDESLVFDGAETSMVLPKRKEAEDISTFLETLGPETPTIRRDSRKAWLRVMEERDKSKKQLKDAKERIRYWTAKAKANIESIKRCDSQLAKLASIILSDLMRD